MSSQMLFIEPGRFIASAGKLDSQRRYVQLVEPPIPFDSVFPVGKTIDLPTRGLRYEINGVEYSTGTGSTFTSDFLRITT